MNVTSGVWARRPISWLRTSRASASAKRPASMERASWLGGGVSPHLRGLSELVATSRCHRTELGVGLRDFTVEHQDSQSVLVTGERALLVARDLGDPHELVSASRATRPPAGGR